MEYLISSLTNVPYFYLLHTHTHLLHDKYNFTQVFFVKPRVH